MPLTGPLSNLIRGKCMSPSQVPEWVSAVLRRIDVYNYNLAAEYAFISIVEDVVYKRFDSVDDYAVGGWTHSLTVKTNNGMTPRYPVEISCAGWADLDVYFDGVKILEYRPTTDVSVLAYWSKVIG